MGAELPVEEVSPQVPTSAQKIRSVRGELIDAWYSGKAHAHGGNIQAVMAPDGFPLWVSPAEPGSVHDITAARLHALPALYHAAAHGLPALADPGYDGAGIGIHIPVKQPPGGQDLDIDARTRNALLRSLRCLGERGFALLTGRWRTLQHVTASPSRIGDIARAALVLTHFEYGYINWKSLRSLQCRSLSLPFNLSGRGWVSSGILGRCARRVVVRGCGLRVIMCSR